LREENSQQSDGDIWEEHSTCPLIYPHPN